MLNPFIKRYTEEQALGKDSFSAMNAALSELKQVWQDKLENKNQNATSKKWLGFFNGSLSHQKTIKILAAELDLIDALQLDLQNRSKHDDTLDVAKVLNAHLEAFAHVQQAYELLSFLIKNIGMSFSPLPCSLVTHPESALFQALDHSLLMKRLRELLVNKKLEPTIFIKTSHESLNLESPLSEHARWAYQNIYKVEYPGGVARSFHGIQHVSRAALYVPVLANIFRKFHDPEALALRDEDIKLLQIGALFHDSAREGEYRDRWDHESALFLYAYLTQILNVDRIKAKFIAEATANKDSRTPFEITEDSASGQMSMSWGFNTTLKPSKNIYQKIIHDADCLDIIRVRDHFQADYLDFFKEIASINTDAFETMAHLIPEVRSLIALGGDTFKASKKTIKVAYEQENGYLNLLNDVASDIHPIIHALHSRLLSHEELASTQLCPEITPYDPAAGLTEENMRSAMKEGKIFVRGIAEPSTLLTKRGRSKPETAGHLEVRKTMRAMGIPTQTLKANRIMKHGNPARSVSLIGFGASVFASAGAMILNPNLMDCRAISSSNLNSGFGKRKALQAMPLGSISLEEQQQKLRTVFTQLKKGGQGRVDNYKGTHVEIIYDITRWDAIYYCEDSNISNTYSIEDGSPKHPYAPILQAIMLRKEYEQQYEKTRMDFRCLRDERAETMFCERFGETGLLPIFHYSGLHHQLERVPEAELTDKKVVDMWVAMCGDFITESLYNHSFFGITNMLIDDIKVQAMYGEMTSNAPNFRGNDRRAADINYTKELQKHINAAIEKQRTFLIEKYVEDWRQKIMSGKLSLVDDCVFNDIIDNRILRATLPTTWLTQAIYSIASPVWFQARLFKKDCGTSDVAQSSIDFRLPHHELTLDNEAVRLYAIAKLVNNDDLIERIQQRVIDLALACIEKITLSTQKFSGVIYPVMMNELMELDDVVKAFNIDLKIKDQLDSMKNEVFKQISIYPYSDEGDGQIFSQYFPAIQKLYQREWFNPNINLTPAEVVMRLFATQLMSPNPHNSAIPIIMAYLNLNGLLKQTVDKNAIRTYLLNNCKTFQINFFISETLSEDSVFYNITRYLPLIDEHNDLFEIITTSRIDFLTLELWLNYLINLKKIMPQEKFTKKQALILSRTLDTFAENMLATPAKKVNLSLIW